MSTALVFPGQGTQKPGMGMDMAEAYGEARHVFEEVDEALGENLSTMIWTGDEATLTLTRNAQPAIMTTSMAVLRVLESRGLSLAGIDCMAGHSLGEFTALCAAGVFSLADTARLLRIRGDAMQSAVSEEDCCMAAILGLGHDAVAGIVADTDPERVCEIANDNDPFQVVISGHTDAVEIAMIRAREAGARRVVKLRVSAPFHSSLMIPAARRLEEAFADIRVSDPVVPVIANHDVTPYASSADVVTNLTIQAVNTVRWRETMLWMQDRGIRRVIEIGSGNALTGLARRTVKSVNCHSVGEPGQIDETIRMMEKEA